MHWPNSQPLEIVTARGSLVYPGSLFSTVHLPPSGSAQKRSAASSGFPLPIWGNPPTPDTGCFGVLMAATRATLRLRPTLHLPYNQPHFRRPFCSSRFNLNFFLSDEELGVFHERSQGVVVGRFVEPPT